jgi:hypothetical protein
MITSQWGFRPFTRNTSILLSFVCDFIFIGVSRIFTILFLLGKYECEAQCGTPTCL